MSEIKDLILSDANLLDYFKDKPLFEMLQRRLSVKQINSEILSFESDLDEGEFENQEIAKLNSDRRINFVLTVLTDLNEEVRKLCVTETAEQEAVGEISPGDPDLLTKKKIFFVYFNQLIQYFAASLLITDVQHVQIQSSIVNFKEIINKLEKETDKLNELILKEKTKVQEKYKDDLKELETFDDVLEELEMKNDEVIALKIKEGNDQIFQITKTKYDEMLENQKFLDLSIDESEKEKKKLRLESQKINERMLKAEQTLQTMLLKFDNDIGSRSNELETLRNELFKTKTDFNLWMTEKSLNQKILHEQLMSEKAEVERRELEERLEEIRQNHAAKVIQKAWRTYNKWLKSQQKGKKGKPQPKKKGK